MNHRGRILVVDDEPNARTALAELLREEGYDVETAADGLMALPKLDKFEPDLVLTDLEMPGLDGLGLIRKVHERAPGRAIVVMSALPARDITDAVIRIGTAGYVLKPINLPNLFHTIERAIARPELLGPAAQ